MPLINLIEEQRQEAKRLESKVRMAFLTFVGAAGLSAVGFGFMLFKAESAAGDVAKLKADALKLKPLTSEIKENQKVLAELTPRLKTLEDAQAISARWDRILAHLARNTPSPLWLTDMRATFNDPTKPVQTNFIGLSDGLEPVGEFIMRLQACADLENVNLKFAQEKVVSDGKGIEFAIDAAVAGTAEEKPKKAKKEEGSA